MNLTLEFEDNIVRMAGTEQNPEWVARDVCRALGITWNGSTLDNIPDDEKGVCKVQTAGGSQKMVTLTEPGLYRLIFSCRKPAAEKLQRWLLHEVLPKIRQTGQYAGGQDPILAMLEQARLSYLNSLKT